MATPPVTLPSLRGFIGQIALRKTTSTTTNRALYKLQGATTDNDQDVQDVVNVAIDAIDSGPGTGQITNIMVAADAAIDGSKISPVFSSLAVNGVDTRYPTGGSAAGRSSPGHVAYLATTSADPDKIIYTHAMPSSAVVLAEAWLTGIRSDETVHIAQLFSGCFRVSSGGVITQIGSTDIPTMAPGRFSNGTITNFAPSFGISGSNLQFRVTPPNDDEPYNWLLRWKILQIDKN